MNKNRKIRIWHNIKEVVFIIFMIILVCFTLSMCKEIYLGKIQPTAENCTLTMIGIAVSVWIGLNIYNVLSKEDIENKIEIALTSIEQSENDLKLATLINISKEYPVSYLFSLMLSNVQSIYLDDINTLLEIEYLYMKMTENYEKGNFEATVALGEEGYEIIKRKYKDYEKYTYKHFGLNQYEFLSMYYKCRYADFIYYINYVYDRLKIKEVNIKDLEKSIELYKALYKDISKQNMIKIDCLNGEICAYIYNTIALTYTMIIKHLIDRDVLSRYLEEAIKYYNIITYHNEDAPYQYENRPRYYRNYAALLEKYKNSSIDEKKSIYGLYKKALELDTSDHRAYNAYYSYCLKEIENLIKENDKLFYELSLSATYGGYQATSISQFIDNTIFDLEKAIRIVPSFCDTYFNIAKAYMLKYFFSGKNDDSLLEKGIEYCNTALHFELNANGPLFIERNIYEMWKKINKAKEFNAIIKQRNVGFDYRQKEKLYEEKLAPSPKI